MLEKRNIDVNPILRDTVTDKYYYLNRETNRYHDNRLFLGIGVTLEELDESKSDSQSE